MQFDILYVHPTRRLTDIKYSVMPAGIFGLLDILYNRGFAIGGINVGIELSIDPEYKIEKELAELEYKVILIDLHWYEHAYGAIELARLSKVSHPDVPVVLGGFTATLYADEIMKGHGCVDYILKGDSELPIALLAEYLLRNQEELTRIPNLSYRKDNMVLSNPIEYMCDCIDDINFVPQKYFKNAQYIYFTTPIGINKSTSQYWLEIARGCYYNCSYCCGSSENSEKLFGRKNMIIASPRAVSENIKRLHNLGIKYICVTHDFEMFGKRYYNDLFDLIRNYKIKPGLYHECFQLPNEDFIEQLADTFDLDNLKLAM